MAELSDGPLGLEDCLASDFPGLSSQAPLGRRSEQLPILAIALLPESVGIRRSATQSLRVAAKRGCCCDDSHRSKKLPLTNSIANGASITRTVAIITSMAGKSICTPASPAIVSAR